MKNGKVISYLNMSYLIISIIPIMIILATVLIVFNNHMMDSIHQSKIEQVEQIKNLVDKALYNTEDQAYVLLATSNLLELKDVTEITKTTMDNLILIHRLINDMENTQTMNNLIETIFIHNFETDMLFTSNGYAGLISEYNHLGWTQIDPSYLDWTFSYEINSYSPIPQLNILMRKGTSPFLHQFEGELIVNLNEQSLLSLLASFSLPKDVDLTIVDDRGNYLIGTNPELNIDLKRIAMDNNNLGYFINHSEQINYYSRSDSGWYYVQSNRYNAFQFALSGIIPAILVILTVLILFIYVASRFFTSRVYAPLDDIIKRIVPVSSDHERDNDEYALLDSFINRIQDRNTELSDFLTHNRRAIKDSLIKKLISGQTGEDLNDQLEYIEFPRNKELYFAIYMDLSSFEDQDSFIEGMWPTWHQLILSLCEVNNNENFTCMGIGEDVHRLILIAGTNDIDLALRASNQLISLVKNRLNRRIQLIHGSYYSHLEDLSLSYSQARELSEKNIFKDLDTVLLCQAESGEKEETYGSYPLDQEKQILEALKVGNTEKAMLHFESFLPGQGDSHHRSLLESNCIFLVSRIIRELGQWEYAVNNDIIAGLIKNDKYVERIISWFGSFFDDIVTNSKQLDSLTDKYNEVIDFYIRANYHNPITLEHVADSIGISYSYIRKIFSGIFGCGFAYYLNMLRIEEAKSLLEKTSVSIESIAADTGFTSMPSFHRNFKSMTGFTPSGFRRHIKESQIRGTIASDY